MSVKFQWYFSVLLIALLVWSANAQVQGLKRGSLAELKAVLHDMCTRQVGIDEGLISKWKQGIILSDKKMKCYLKCLMMETTVLDPNGAIDFGPLGELLPADVKESVRKFFPECVSRADKSQDLCEKAFIFTVCMQEMDPKAFRIFWK